MKFTKLSGFIVAPFTCFHDDGNVNLAPIKEYSELLKRNKASGVFILGTTGEGISMTVAERKAVAEEWIKTQDPSFKIIVHVGSPSIKASQELAAHAQEIDAYAIGCMGPNFFKPGHVDDLVEHISKIAGCCPNLPVYYYHMPAMSGVALSMPEFLKRASSAIPNLCGIKFTHHDLMEFNQCMEVENEKFDILHGYDEILICGLALGVRAAVGSTYNYFLPVYIRLWEAFESGDLDTARSMQRLSVQLVSILVKYRGGVACGKAIMNLIGIPCGPCRLPIRNLTLSEIDQLKKDLEEMRFFNTKELIQAI